MIYTIGYQALKPEEIFALAAALKARVVDVRSSPVARRKPALYRKALEARLGPSGYIWRGDVLGGRAPGILPEGLDWLASQEGGQILMCLEEAPADCHRHAIAMMLSERPEPIPVTHIYRDETILATELERSCVAGDEYEYAPIGEVFAALAGG